VVCGQGVVPIVSELYTVVWSVNGTEVEGLN